MFVPRLLRIFLLVAQLASGQLSLVCSGISPSAPGRVSLYFGSRSSPSENVTGGVKIRSAGGLVVEKKFALSCAPPQPLDPAQTTSQQWANAIIQGCSFFMSEGRFIGDIFSKITCYKRFEGLAPLDAESGGIFHVAAVGESNDAATNLVPSTAAGLVQSFWVVPIDDIPAGWWGITQELDGPKPVEPCPDLVTITKTNNRRTVTTREMYPCSIGFSGRWYWFHISPPGGIERQGCVGPPTRNVGRSDIRSDNVQAFCSNVPDGFICPVTCNKRAPIGEVQCENGAWSSSFRCRPLTKVCLSGVSQFRVTNNGQSYYLTGVIPDGRSECDLFSRKGKKCGAICNGQGEFACGQLKCNRSGRRRTGAPIGEWKAVNSHFDCKNPTTDGLVNRPTIVKLEPDGQNIKITADFVKDPTRVISPVERFYFRETTGVMTCTSPEQNALELTRNTEGDEADDPEEPDDDLDDGVDAARRLALYEPEDEPEVDWPNSSYGHLWSRRLNGGDLDTCNDDAEFTRRNNQCFPDGNDGNKCNSCSGQDLNTSTCWAQSRRARDCANDPRSGDFLSCQFTGQFGGQVQVCYAAPPWGYCVKKVCAKQGSAKFCRSYDPPTSGQYCIGDAMSPDPIEHAVVRYECCNPNLLTFTGSCGGGNPADIALYEVMAGARNQAGNQWSLPVSLTCAPISLRQRLNREKYEIPEKCSRLLPGESCEVGCGANYILQRRNNRGTFTCQLGMNRQPAGNFPRCRARPSGRNKCEGQAHNPTTTTTTALPADCEACAAIGNYKDSRFEQCRFWGDPHITKSWRPKQRFNFQDTGIHRYARAARCAGNFELHVFQCQYSRGRNSVATGMAARINGNATIFISDRTVETTGGVFVEPDGGAIVNDRNGVNVQSDDECVFFNVNVKQINKNPGFLHNMKLHMFGQDITHDGICGAADLKTQYIDPNSTDMIFTQEQHQLLCNQCVGSGGRPPRGCVDITGIPKTYSEGCDFLAPLLGINKECTPEDDERFAQLQDSNQNCVVYTVLNKRSNCNDFCEEKGSTCVAAKDANGVCAANGRFNNVPCSRKMYDVLCVCKKPDNTAPGTTAIQACEDSDMTLAQAEALCRSNNFIGDAHYPPRNTDPNVATTAAQDEADEMLEDCMIDVCSTGLADAQELAQNLETENPLIIARTCAFTDGTQYEIGAGAYPCACGGAECQLEEVCTVVNNVGTCSPLTTTNTVTSLTSTTSATSTRSSTSTHTLTSTSETQTRSSTTTLTTTSLSTSSTSRTSTSFTSSLTSTTSATTTSTSSVTTTLTGTSTSATSSTSLSSTSSATATTSTTVTFSSTSATSSTTATSSSTTLTGTSSTITVTLSVTSVTATTSTGTSTSATSTTSSTSTTTSATSTRSSSTTTSSTSTSSSSTSSSSSSSTTVTSTTSTSTSSSTTSSSSTTMTSTTSTSTTSSSTTATSSTTLTSSSTTSTMSTTTVTTSSSTVSSTTTTSSITTSSTSRTSTSMTSTTSSTTSVSSTVTTSTKSSTTSTTTRTSTTSTTATSTSTTTSSSTTSITSSTTSTTSATSTVSTTTSSTTRTSTTTVSTTSVSTTTASTTSTSRTSTTTSFTTSSTSRTSTSSTATSVTQTLTGTSSTATSTSSTSTSSTATTYTSSSTTLTSSTTTSTSTSTRTSTTITVTTTTTSSTSISTTITSTTSTTTASSTTSRTTYTSTSSTFSSTTSSTTDTVSTTSTSATTSTTRTKTSYTTSTTTTLTTTTTYFTTLMCGPWNPSGGNVLIEWDGGEFVSEEFLNDGNGWEWRVEMRKQEEGAEWFLVEHCSDIAVTECEVWCLEPGATYDVRVQLASTIPDLTLYEIFGSVVTVPNVRAGAPEDLAVLTPTASSLEISWNASEEQGNCTFRGWQVEIRDPNGAWTKDPPACGSLTSFDNISCNIINLPCQTAYIIQVRQLCWNDESTSEWSRPITGSTLVTIGPNCLQAATQPTSLALASTAESQLELSWTAGMQEDSAFINWHVELYKIVFVGGQPEPEAQQQIAGVCPGLLDRSTTTCTVTGLPWGQYTFAVKEVSSLPSTSSPLSPVSMAVWVPRIPATPPTSVSIGEATATTLRVTWVNGQLKDGIFQRTVVELFNGTGYITPAGCDIITDVSATTCVATGLQSQTSYSAVVSVLCDECADTPSAQRVTCTGTEAPDERCLVPAAGGLLSCFRKLNAFRASSSASTPSLTVATLPRREATPVLGLVQVPTDSGQRVTFDWVAGSGSAGNTNISSDCVFQSWQLEIQKADENVWASPEGCLSLTDPMASSCTALNLQCDTAYNARLRVLCTVTAASSDWMAFPSFSTAYAGACLKTASAPQLIRNSSRTATSLTVAFIAGSAGDCIFDRFELQYQVDNTTTWINTPVGCGSLSVRSGPSCTVTNLAQDTGYSFRARELCTNGAPLASPWGVTEEPLRTSFVPIVQQPTYLEPMGLISPVDPPTRLVLIFEVDLQLSNSASSLSLCPSFLPTATPEDPGVCNCGSAAACQANCLTQATMTVELVTPRVLFAQFGSLLRPLTGCPYNVLLEEGFLQTQLQPPNPSPRIQWAFLYWPPIPTGSLTLYSSTTTSLTVRVSWSRPMTTTCGVQVGSSVMMETAPLDFTGSREFLEVRVAGLTPFTQYTVVCTGIAISDPMVSATVSEAALSTERDTDDRLSEITLLIQAVCTPLEVVNGTTNTSTETNESNANATEAVRLVPLEAALFPPFEPSVRHYQLNLNAEDVLTLCGDGEVEAVFRIQVSALTLSAFASVSVEPSVQILAQLLPDETGFLPPDVPRSAVSQVLLSVSPPQQGASPPEDYLVDVVLGVLDVRLENTTMPAILAADASTSADFVISVPSDVEASTLGLRIGPFSQLLVLTGAENYTENLLLRTRYFFSVANLVGLGSELTVVVQVRPPADSIYPTLDVRTIYIVSFVQPVVIQIVTNMINNTISITQFTQLTVSGTHLAVPANYTTEPLSAEIFVSGVPANCTTSECQEPTLQELLVSGAPNLCTNLVVLDTGTLSCAVTPSANARLGLCLVLRRGLFSERYCAAYGPPGSVRPEQPSVGGLEQPAQDMSSSDPIIVVVDGDLPPDNVSQGYLQVWATPLPGVPDDVSNPGDGYQPLCSQAVRSDNSTIVCYRTQNFNVSQTGAQPNVYVQSGPDATSSNLIEGGLQITQPRIREITRSHEFEVGALQVTITGENFGTDANGVMVVQVETFGANTQSVPDLQLAPDLGAPTHFVACRVISHTETEVTCEVESQSLFGAEISSQYYSETVEVDDASRRLQEAGEPLDLAKLALRLSQLPVAFSVSYELDCSVLQRLNQTCGSKPDGISVLSREWQAVRLKPCPAGERRVNYTGTECVQCLPGKYKSGVGPALYCDFCDLGFFMGLPGAGACQACPQYETTLITGATEIVSCDCAPGYFRTSGNETEWQLASFHGVCQPCPQGAICDGGSALPYSADGYWTPERLTFWPCFPDHACLQGDASMPNLCEESRDPESVRCGRCATNAYSHQSECYTCYGGDILLAWLGPFLYPLLMIFGFLPPLIRSLRSMDMDHTKKARRLIRTEKHTSWLGRLAESDHGEFRMIIIMVTCLQTLWIVSLMPLPYTRFTQDWLWAVGIVAWDLSIFRPQCAFRLSYFMKWFTQWFAFFIMVFLLVVCMLFYCKSHKNRNHDLGYIRPKRGLLGVISCTLMLLLIVHLRDDLIFVGCIPCENEKWCLAFQPVIECATTNWEWTTMTILSILDLLFVILGSIPVIAMCIYKSWRWQHGDARGLDPDFSAPWYVFFSEFWVKRHRGYIQEVRQAVPEFQQLFKEDQEAAEMHQELWQKAIDLILAQEAEKAEMLLIRVIRHLYAHSPRFRVIDEDEGPTFQIIRVLRDYIVGGKEAPIEKGDLSIGLLSPIEENENEVEDESPEQPETGDPPEKITRLDDDDDDEPVKTTRLDDGLRAPQEEDFDEIVTESLAVPKREVDLAAAPGWHEDRLDPEAPPEPEPGRPDGPDPEEPVVNPPPDDPPVPQPPNDNPVVEPEEMLKVSDVHHVSLTLENLVDYAKWSIPGARAFKRVLSYSWCFILLLTRFAVIIYAMLMRRDRADVPLVYLLITLGYVILEATLQPYVWTYLNDWEVSVHVLIYVFMLFVISGWSDTASEVLVVVATLAAIVPVILRFLILCFGEEDTEDPTDMSIAKGVASYHLHQLTDGGGTVSLGVSSTSSSSTTSSVSTVGGEMEHVRKYIELVKKRHITVVEKTLDDQGQEVERTTHTEEVETEGVTYSFDMTKSEVAKVMQGVKDERPPPGQGGDDVGETHQITADEATGLIPLTDLDVQSEVFSSDEEIQVNAV